MSWILEHLHIWDVLAASCWFCCCCLMLLMLFVLTSSCCCCCCCFSSLDVFQFCKNCRLICLISLPSSVTMFDAMTIILSRYLFFEQSGLPVNSNSLSLTSDWRSTPISFMSFSLLFAANSWLRLVSEPICSSDSRLFPDMFKTRSCVYHKIKYNTTKCWIEKTALMLFIHRFVEQFTQTHTANEAKERGSKRNFSPDGSRWFSICSSTSSLRFSRPSSTFISLPPKCLVQQSYICRLIN